MKIKTFEEFTREKHINDNPGLLDDMISDDYDYWVSNLDADSWLEIGEEYRDYLEFWIYENKRRK